MDQFPDEYTYPPSTPPDPFFELLASFPGTSRLSVSQELANHNQPVQKITAIAFVFVFVCSQYARQVLYLECRVTNNFKSVAEKCDCNKIIDTDSQDPVQPLSKSHSHLHIDELFAAAHPSIFELSSIGRSRELLFRGNDDEREGTRTIPYQPPRPVLPLPV